jgi:hypothetical protein
MESASRPLSRRSSRSGSRSQRRRSDVPTLGRIVSSQFPDDHSVYYLEDEGPQINVDVASLHAPEIQQQDIGSTSSVDEKEEVKDEIAHQHETRFEGIRGGVPYEEDVEVPAPLEPKKSSRSVKDPNLVTWESETDPNNPKNCKQVSILETHVTYPLMRTFRVDEAEVGSNINCILLHTSFANILVHDCSGCIIDSCRVAHYQ